MPPFPISPKRHSEQFIESQPDHALTKQVASGAQGNQVAIYGSSVDNAGLYGSSENNIGVVGTSDNGTGMWAETNSPTGNALYAENTSATGHGAAVYGKMSTDAGHAGFFEGRVYATRDIWTDGDVVVTKGSIRVLKGDVLLTGASDCAEDFDVSDSSSAEPGTVMVLSGESCLSESASAYDTRVAGVVSGAGTYKPGIILDRQDRNNRHPIALLGKVYCKVDATFGAIAPGDLLTTSPRRGHAMKVQDPVRGFGSVLGKAMGSLTAGSGLIPVLVTLR
jgi:hypothetical protein